MITVIESGAGDRIRIGAWKVMLRELWASRELIHRLSARNISGQFRQSFLGYTWMVLPPIAVTVTFSLLREANIVAIDLPPGSMPYALFALVGATVWGAFTQAALVGTGSLAVADTLVSKIYFPREALVISSVTTTLVNLLIQLLVIATSCILFRFLPSASVLIALLHFIPLLLLSTGVALFLAPMNAIMNDTQRLLQFIFQFGMFLSPTVYPTPVLRPDSGAWEIGLHWLHRLNPVSHWMDGIRGAMQGASAALTLEIMIANVAAVLVFLAGWRFFHAGEPFIAERL